MVGQISKKKKKKIKWNKGTDAQKDKIETSFWSLRNASLVVGIPTPFSYLHQAVTR